MFNTSSEENYRNISFITTDSHNNIIEVEIKTSEYTKEEQDEAIRRRHQAQFENSAFGQSAEATSRVFSTLLNKSDIEEYAKTNGYNLTNDLNQNSQWEKTLPRIFHSLSEHDSILLRNNQIFLFPTLLFRKT